MTGEQRAIIEDAVRNIMGLNWPVPIGETARAMQTKNLDALVRSSKTILEAGVTGGDARMSDDAGAWFHGWMSLPQSVQEATNGAQSDDEREAERLRADPAVWEWIEETRRSVEDGAFEAELRDQPPVDEVIAKLKGRR